MFSPLIQYSEDGGRAAPAGAAKLKLVEAVGCLVRSESQAWMLHRASSPVVTTGQSTSAAELRQSATIPLGSQTYRLLGVDEFGPQRAGAHKVAVKGVLIKDANDSRLNVTSLQAVAGACS
jgi:hypothetical protein